MLLGALLCVACDPDPVRPDSGDSDAGPGSDECLAPRTTCGSQCVDTSSDPRHCGTCNNRCDSFCSEGACATSCAGSLTACGDACVDLATSPDHCGDCDNACAADEMCQSGGCVCADGLADCGGSCVDRMTSSLHCGRCDNPCEQGEVCEMGTCQSSSEVDCNDMMDNDNDGMEDCEDPDCYGTERVCASCPGGLEPPAGHMGDITQVCDAGTWGDCMPCGDPPDCSPSNPCADGFRCNASMTCELDPNALWDAHVEDVTYFGSGYDSFGGAPDVTIETCIGSFSGPDSSGGSGQAPSGYPTCMGTYYRAMADGDGVYDNFVNPPGGTSVTEPIAVAQRTSALTGNRFSIRLTDYDALNQNDIIGTCFLSSIPTSYFDSVPRTVTCTSPAMPPAFPGWRVRLRLDPVPP